MKLINKYEINGNICIGFYKEKLSFYYIQSNEIQKNID